MDDKFKVKNRLNINPKASPTLDAKGDIAYDSDTDLLKYYDGATKTVATTADITAHTGDATDAHAASAITNTPSGNLAATNVQSALNELQSDIDTRVVKITGTDNAIVRSDGTAGAIQNTGITIDDSDNITMPASSNIKMPSTAKLVDSADSDNYIYFPGAQTIGFHTGSLLTTWIDGFGPNIRQGSYITLYDNALSTIRIRNPEPITAGYTMYWPPAQGAAGSVMKNDGSGNLSFATIVNANIAAGAAIDATKIADGSVTSTEFQYISTVTSNVQTQLDAKAPSSSPTLTTPTMDIVTLDGQGSTPASPSAGYYKAYVADSDGKLKILNSSGIVTTVGSGAGGINYMNVTTNNSDAEGNSVGDWAAYADAAATTPVDGTGGSPNSTITVSSSSPLRGTYSYLITKGAANRQGEGVACAFTIDSADKSKQLAISFDYSASANYTGSTGTEYLVCYVYDVTNATLIATSNVNMPQGDGTQTITFDSTTSTSYRLIFHVAGTGTSSWTYKFDNVKVGPQEVIMAPAVSDWTAFTSTGGLTGGTTSFTGYYRRVGDSMEVRLMAVYSSVFTGGSATFTIPSGFTIDTTKFSTTPVAGLTVVGHGYFHDVGTESYPADVFYQSTSSVILRAYQDDSGATSTLNTYSGITTTQPFTWANGDIIGMEFTVPIANWSSNIQLANSRVEYASNSGMTDAADTTSFVNDPNGSPIPAATYTNNRAKRVRFKNPIQAGDTLMLQIKPNNSVNSWIDIPLSWRDAGSSTTVENLNSSSVGAGIYDIVNSTDVDVIWYRYQQTGAGNWSASNTGRWRVVKYSNAAPVEQAAINSEVVVQDANGYGSSGTKTLKFSNVLTNTGNGITVSNDATTGCLFTINEAGVYSMSFTHDYSGAGFFGITRNASSGATAINGLAAGSVLAMQRCTAADLTANCAVTRRLNLGDVIRAHGDATGEGAGASYQIFSICKVSN